MNRWICTFLAIWHNFTYYFVTEMRTPDTFSNSGGDNDLILCKRKWKKKPDPLLICNWILKNQVGKIKFDKLDFYCLFSLQKSIFWNWFLDAKNPVWFLQLDFSKLKYRSCQLFCLQKSFSCSLLDYYNNS